MRIPATFRVALCLFPNVTSLDYQGPFELFGPLLPKNVPVFNSIFPGASPNVTFDVTYLSHTLEPIEPMSGPTVLPERTYDSVKKNEQFDIIFVPGGPTGRPGQVPEAALDFIKHQVPGAKHLLTACTGSWIVASTGLLRGKRATSNKAVFKEAVEDTRGRGIDWIAKARFVVNDDKKIWTSSGVAAGMDMASAFLDYLVGEETATLMRAFVEFTAKGADDDDFAAFYGLV